MRQQRRTNQRMRSPHSKGQSLAEYALVLALVCVVAMSSLGMLGDSIKNQLAGLTSTIAQISSTSGGGGGPSSAGAALPPSSPMIPAAVPASGAGSTPATGSTAQGGCSGSGCATQAATGW